MNVVIKKERDSNFELCRLACMFYIVIYHLIIHVPDVYENTIWGRPIRTLCHIGVIVFVMISGYYGIRRKWNRLIKLALSVSFYNGLGLILAVLIFGVPFKFESLLPIILPITKGGYWFITSYIVLYLIAPYINIVFESVEKREFHIILAVLVGVVCYGGGLMDCEIGNGRGILAFVLSYSMGFYIHRFYPNGFSFPIVGNRPALVYWSFFFVLFVAIAFLPKMLSKAVNFMCFGYNEIGLFLMSILFLLMFHKFRMKNRYINWSATSVLGIYLLHGNPYVSSLVVYPLYTGIFNHVGNQVLLFVIHILFAFVVILIFQKLLFLVQLVDYFDMCSC